MRSPALQNPALLLTRYWVCCTASVPALRTPCTQVRAVAEAGCAGPAPLAFWGALGFAVRFGFAREGHRYALEHDGHSLQARHCSTPENHFPPLRKGLWRQGGTQHLLATG